VFSALGRVLSQTFAQAEAAKEIPQQLSLQLLELKLLWDQI
jgi:hypothetical protein